MRPRFRPLRVSDFYDIEVTDYDRAKRHWLLANPLVLHQVAENPFCFAMATDRPIGLGGVTPNHEIWGVASPEIGLHLVRFTRYVRKMMEFYGRPVWATVAHDNPAGARWASTLGMQRTKVGEIWDTWASDARSL